MHIVQILVEFLINFRDVLDILVILQIRFSCKHLQRFKFTLFDEAVDEFDTTQVLEVESC
jgi:hypothetical protein